MGGAFIETRLRQSTSQGLPQPPKTQKQSTKLRTFSPGSEVTCVKPPHRPQPPHAELLHLLPKKEKSSVYNCRYRQPATAEIPVTRPLKRRDGFYWDRWMRTRNGSTPDIEAYEHLVTLHHLTKPARNYLSPDLLAEYQQVCSTTFNHMKWTKAFTSPLKYFRWRFSRPRL